MGRIVLEFRDSYFYPRPLRGGRQQGASSAVSLPQDFYPRPLRGGRRGQEQQLLGRSQFLSTPSARRATGHHPRLRSGGQISIHALCEEGDIWPSSEDRLILYFYPRPLRGGRRACTTPKPNGGNFYPRPLRGGRPMPSAADVQDPGFLSTPSARRATYAPPGIYLGRNYFYPRPLRGGRQQKQRQNLYFQTNYTTFCTNLEEL